MLIRFRRLWAAGLSALFSVAMLYPSSAVIAESIPVTDRNEDGVIDVFDYVLAKRAIVAENTPVNLSISHAVAAPGDTVSVCVSVSGNPGFSDFAATVCYDPAVSPAYSEEDGSFLQVNPALYQSADLSVIPMDDVHQIYCAAAKPKTITEDDGLFCCSFRVPADAAPGTVYSLSLADAVLKDDSGAQLPILMQRGSISIVDSAELPGKTTEPQQSETTAATTTTTTIETTATTTTTLSPTQTTMTTTTVTSSATTTTTVSVSSAKTSASVSSSSSVSATKVVPSTEGVIKKGIDISAYQNNVDFKKVAKDPHGQFVILRAGFGKYLKQEDKCFRSHYIGAKAAGIPVGAYWFSYATTPETAKIEANVCAQVLGDRKFEYPIAFDIETPEALNQKPEKVSAIIEAFCSEMEKMGYYAMLYCSTWFLSHNILESTCRRYSVWCANYNVFKPKYYTGSYGIWQYGLTQVDGIVDNKGKITSVDADFCYQDYPQFIKSKHRNGY